MADWTSLLNALDGACLAAFGREVVYRKQSADEVTIRAIFHPGRESEETSPGVYAAMFVRLADLPGPAQLGDEVIFDDAAYKVFRIEVGGQGSVMLSVRID